MSQLQVEDVWPLAPLQEGLLFHAAYDEDANRDVYVGQRVLNLEGPLDKDVFRASWQALLDRHASLRAGFHQRASGDAAQVIAKRAELPWRYEDVSRLPVAEAMAEAARLAEQDRRRFDLAVPPLLRLLLIEIGPEHYQVVVTMHHILMDGWSLPVLFGELWAVYGEGGDAGKLPPVPPYRDYLSWLVRQDKDAARASWRDMLAGVTEPTQVGPADRGGPPVMLQHVITESGAELAAGLRALARRHGLTLNIVLQGVWGLLVGKLAGRSDVVFGATVSGRPAELPGVERMLGLFINTVPVRVQLDPARPFAAVLGDLQAQQTALLDAQHLGLTDIQRTVGPGAGFDTLLVFQNYPRGPAETPRLGPPPSAGSPEAPAAAGPAPTAGRFYGGPPPGGGPLRGGPLRGGPLRGGPLRGGPLQGPPPGGGDPRGGPLQGGPLQGGPLQGGPPPGAIEGERPRYGAIKVTGAGGEEAAHYPLTLVVTPAGEMELRLDYRPDVFDEAIVQGLMGRLVRVLKQVAADPQIPVGRVDVLDDTERDLVLRAWNDTAWPLPEGSVSDLFERQVAGTPDAVALVDGAGELTYRELNGRSNALAHRLIAAGVGPESLVGIVMERSAALVVALLGVLKAGGAYVPLDRKHPIERLRAVAAEAAVSVLLVDEAAAKDPAVTDGAFGPVDVLTVAAADLADSSVTNPEVPLSPVNLAYVMYTSGSTGVPKGVAVTHGNVLSFCCDRSWADDVVERVLVQANHAFDASTYELWVPLLRGGRLVIVPPGEVDAIALGKLIAEQQVTNVHATAGLFSVLAEQTPHIFAGVREVSTGGDVVSAAAIRALLETHPGMVVRTTYGPTENTSFTTQLPFTAADPVPASVPIGRPLDNTQVFVLDEFLRPLPPGVTGELYVTGAGLARGYVGRVGMTAERFVACPFPGVRGYDRAEVGGGRMYRTGDLGRWTAAGELEFAGRADHQVKIRGFRVEPGELEAVLSGHELVTQTVVIAQEDQPGVKRLVAYVVPIEGTDDALGATLRDYVAARLPDYMVPAAVLTLDAIPVTVNGKLDRAALPALDFAGLVTGREPATPIEAVLCGLFAEVLSLERVGADDSFFELGGDSIMSMQVVSRARRAGLVITPRQVFELQTPAELARVAGTLAESNPADAAEDVPTGVVPLTPVMLDLVERTGSAAKAGAQSMLVNAPTGMRLSTLAAALQLVLDRHDLLRARLADAPVPQLVVPDVGSAEAVSAMACVRRVDATGLDIDQQHELHDTQARLAFERLDPATGVMVQVVWFDAGPDDAGQLLLLVHHLVVDGVSWRVIVPDLAIAYTELAAGRAPELDPAGTSFRRWAGELAAQATSQRRVGELPAWKQLLAGPAHVLGPRPLDPAFDTVAAGLRRVPLVVPAEVTSALLTRVPAAFHAGVDDVLLAGLVTAVAEWMHAQGKSAVGGLLVAMEGHGREPLSDDMDLTRTLGWFTKTYPVRLDPGQVDFAEVRAGGPDAGRVVKRIKEQLHAVPDDGLGHGLLRYCNPATAPALAGLPTPQIGFNYMGRFGGGGPVGQSAAGTAWKPAGDRAMGGAVDDDMPARHTLEAGGAVRDSTGGPELTVTLESPVGLLDDRVLAELLSAWVAMLTGLAAHTDASGGGHTPSDFSLITLDQADIEEFEATFADARTGE